MDGLLPVPPAHTLQGARPRRGSAPLLLFGNVPFGSAWQRAQQLALCLAESVDVVYVDPNRSFLQPLRRRPAGWLPAEEVPAGLFRFRPGAGLPFARSVAAFNRRNYAQTLRGLRHFLEERGLSAPRAVVVTFPDQVEVAGAFPGTPLVYDLMDEPELFLRPWQQARYRRLHRRLLARADLLVTSSRVLLERYGPHARRALRISNGVRRQLLRDLAGCQPDPILARLPRPVLGYVGMIAHWFDFAAVEALARGFPGGTVVLVGPSEGPLPRLPGNVIQVGRVHHLELAPVLRAFDVGLIPFRRCRAIDAVNPVKLYEYLAAGLPVLSARFEEISDFADVATYEAPGDCVAAARRLLARRTPAEASARRAFARRHCWSVKAEQFLHVLPLKKLSARSGQHSPRTMVAAG
jgi:glycosyltransferase involved in cell wall biosynthesis